MCRCVTFHAKSKGRARYAQKASVPMNSLTRDPFFSAPPLLDSRVKSEKSSAYEAPLDSASVQLDDARAKLDWLLHFLENA